MTVYRRLDEILEIYSYVVVVNWGRMEMNLVVFLTHKLILEGAYGSPVLVFIYQLFQYHNCYSVCSKL